MILLPRLNIESRNSKKYIRIQIKKLQRYTGRKWFPPLIGILAALDNFVIVIPNDGILISSSMLIPKRWLLFAISVTIGSALGAVALAAMIELEGLPWILNHYPELTQSKSWVWSQEFFGKYGLFFVFFIGLSPLMQQPAVILAALANTPLHYLAGVIFFGRLFKFLLMAYLASHSPKYLKKLWGLGSELDEANVKI